MTAQAFRPVGSDPREPVIHELPPIRFEGALVHLRLSLRQTDDGFWRGRLHFLPEAGPAARDTAEILCGPSEQDLWQSVRNLREHHLRDLYRSLA